jgi:hypothetical protein
MALILVSQPAFRNYRLFQGDPTAPAETWSFAGIAGEMTFNTPQSLPYGYEARKIKRGIYIVEPTIAVVGRCADQGQPHQFNARGVCERCYTYR